MFKNKLFTINETWTLLISLWILRNTSFQISHVIINTVSSTKQTNLPFIDIALILLIWILKSRGDKGVYCGTPHKIVSLELKSPFILTYCVLGVKYDLRRFNLRGIPSSDVTYIFLKYFLTDCIERFRKIQVYCRTIFIAV